MFNFLDPCETIKEECNYLLDDDILVYCNHENIDQHAKDCILIVKNNREL